MSSDGSPLLEFYRRDGCQPCDEARIALQIVLEERIRRGDPIPLVRFFDVGGNQSLETTYGSRVPVISLRGQELVLTVSERSIATFLDRVLGRAA
jgi:glutaredoxin-like protein DUF836